MGLWITEVEMVREVPRGGWVGELQTSKNEAVIGKRERQRALFLPRNIRRNIQVVREGYVGEGKEKPS